MRNQRCQSSGNVGHVSMSCLCTPQLETHAKIASICVEDSDGKRLHRVQSLEAKGGFRHDSAVSLIKSLHSSHQVFKSLGDTHQVFNLHTNSYITPGIQRGLSCTTTWVRAWKRVSSLKLGKILPLWRRTTKRPQLDDLIPQFAAKRVRLPRYLRC